MNTLRLLSTRRRLVLTATGALLLFLMARTSSAQEPSAASEIRQTQEKMAQLYEAKNDLPHALAIWQELLKTHPGELKYVDNVCRLATSLGRHAVALPLAQRLVKQAPNNATYRMRLAQTLLALNRSKEALPHLEFALHRAPNDAKLREAIAGVYEEAHRPKLALRQYDWLLTHKPASEKVLSFRLAKARLYADLKQDHRYLTELEALRRAYPKSLSVHRELAAAYLSNGSFSLARRELQTILVLKPNAPKALASLAQLEKALAAAQRRAERERAENARYNDWLFDLQQRAEDF